MSDRLGQLSPFERAMMEIRDQEKPKECDHDRAYSSNGIKVCRKCCIGERYTPNFFNHHTSSDENYSRCALRKPTTTLTQKKNTSMTRYTSFLVLPR